MASTLWARYPGSEEPFLLGDEKTNDAHSVRPEPGGELHARSPRSPLTCRRSSTASSSMGCGTRSRDAEPGKVPLGARGSGSSPRTQLQPSFFPGSLYSGLLLAQFFSRCTYLWFHWRLSCPRGQANISASSHKIKKKPNCWFCNTEMTSSKAQSSFSSFLSWLATATSGIAQNKGAITTGLWPLYN